MANTVTMEFRVTDKGTLKMVGQGATKASKSLDKVSSSAAEADRNTKGVANASSNSTKNFSKMSQGMQGFLVPAYAELAARLFAATAAFNALQRAAQVEQLTKGLAVMGAQSGIAMKTLSQGLREVTGMAISTEEAMRSTAQVISAGFGEEQLMRIGEVARNVSIGLGRDLQDSISRLTRGVIKLEPELLDELGIMVRLDEATEKYKEKLGIVGRELTLTERRQAFMNAVLEEGENKFGALSEVDPNPYNKLSAALADLSQQILAFISIGLEPILAKFAELPLLITSVAGVLIKTIVGRMIPSFKDMAEAASKAAERTKNELADKFADSVIKLDETSTSLLKLDKSFSSPTSKKFFKDLEDGFQGNAQEVKNLSAAIKSNREQITRLEKAGRELDSTQQKKLDTLQKEAQLLTEVERLHKETGQAQFESSAAQIKALREKQVINEAEANSLGKIEDANYGVLGSLRALKVSVIEAGKLFKMQFKQSLDAVVASLTRFGRAGKFAGIIGGGLIGTIKGLGKAFKLLGLGILQALPLLGQLIAIGTLAYDFIRDFFVSEEEEKKSEKIQQINDALEENFEILQKISAVEIKTNKDIADGLVARARALQMVKEKLLELQKVQSKDKPGSSGASGLTSAAALGQDEPLLQQLRTAEIGSTLAVRDFGSRNLKQDIEVTAEIKALANVLDDEYAVSLFKARVGTDNFNEALKKLIKEGRVRDIAIEIADAVINVGSAIGSIQQASTEAGQAYTRFRNKFTATTPFDETLDSITNLSAGADALVESLTETRLDRAFGEIKEFKPTQEAAEALAGSLRGLGSVTLEAIGLKEFVEKPTKEALQSAVDLVKEEEARLKVFQDTVKFSKLREETAKRELSVVMQIPLSEQNLVKAAKERETLNAAIFAEQQLQREQELKALQDTEAKKQKQAEIDQAALQYALDVAKDVYDQEKGRIALAQEMVSYSKKLNDQRKEELNLQKSIAENQMRILNLSDPNRASGQLTAEQQLKIAEDQYSQRVLAAIEEKKLQEASINLEYDLLDAKFAFLKAQLAAINAQRPKDDKIDISFIGRAEEAIKGAREGALKNLDLGYINDILQLVAERRELEVAATRVIPNLQQPARMAQAGLDIEAQRGANLTGEFKAQFDRELQLRRAIVEQQRISAEIEEKKREKSIAGTEQDKYNLQGEIDLLKVKAQEQGVLIEQATENLNNVKRIGLQLGESLSSGLEGALNSIAEGTKSVKQAFGDMAISILQDIQKMIIKMLIMKAIQASLSFIPGGAAIGGFLGFAKEGGIMTPEGKVPGYAVGGIAQGPTQGYPAILHGTEAVVPLPNGKSIPVEMRDAATNNVTVNVSVDNNGNAQTQTQMDNQQAGNLGKVISAAVQEELQRQKRPGGILSPYGAA